MRTPPGLARHLIAHPVDAVSVATSAWALRRRGWWRRRPFLPIPDEAYWRFRMTTALGEPEAVPTVEEVVTAARWSRRERRNR
jgi:hypothetical protein